MDRAAQALLAFGGVSAGLLLYGGLVEAERLFGRRTTLNLPDWPASMDGFTVGLISDLHLSHYRHRDMARAGVEWLVAQNPDVLVVAGDIQNYHLPLRDPWVKEVFEPVHAWGGEAVAVLGNHDYFGGAPDRLHAILAASGIRLLRNERHLAKGVQWVGVDSACVGRSDPFSPLFECDASGPVVVVWHEPDMVDHLPRGTDLMLSGHSHGGQFVLPGGWAPLTSRLGSKYLAGFYPSAPTPLFVTRGVAVTGPPSRFLCPAEVCLLTLRSG
jgi:predicted MPP superfamily phosphohydrolase